VTGTPVARAPDRGRRERPVEARCGGIESGELSRLAVALGLRPRHLVSTIYPRELGDRPLEDVFVTHHPDIYYSIYSMSERFRRRWLPRALPAGAALDRLASWQRSTHKVVSLHHAYIAGENDAEGDVPPAAKKAAAKGSCCHG
jgi:hypothetical protein